MLSQLKLFFINENTIKEHKYKGSYDYITKM